MRKRPSKEPERAVFDDLLRGSPVRKARKLARKIKGWMEEPQFEAHAIEAFAFHPATQWTELKGIWNYFDRLPASSRKRVLMYAIECTSRRAESIPEFLIPLMKAAFGVKEDARSSPKQLAERQQALRIIAANRTANCSEIARLSGTSRANIMLWRNDPWFRREFLTYLLLYGNFVSGGESVVDLPEVLP